MRVILKDDVLGTGRKGEEKEVSRGFAINHLFPRGLAVPSTQETQDKVREQVSHGLRRKAERDVVKKKLYQRLNGRKITFQAPANDRGTLFGGIDAQEIALRLEREMGIPFQISQIEIAEPIKSIGERMLSVRLAGQLVAKVKVVVEAKAGAHR